MGSLEKAFWILKQGFFLYKFDDFWGNLQLVKAFLDT